MLRRIFILDAGLVVLLVLGVMKFRQDWKAFGPLHDPSSIQTGRLTLPALPASALPSSTAPTDWTEIPTHNPFSFDRTDVDIVAAVAPPPKPAGPKPILFGTMLIGKERTAVLTPGSAPTGAARPMKVGDMIDGWTIVEIAASSISVEFNGTRESVIANDPFVQVPRNFGRTEVAPAPAAVVSTNPSAPAATQPSMAPVSAPNAPPSPPAGQARKKAVTTPFGTIYVDEPPQ